MRIANYAIKMAYLDYSAMDQVRCIKFGNKYGYMYFYTNSTFQVQKGGGLGSRDLITNFGTP